MSISDTTLPPVPPDLVKREDWFLAPYAMHSRLSAGRMHPEPPHPYRGPYQRDRDRIIHSAAFRRLSGKMQVFMGEMGDYHRTRLTHTMEVTALARTLARPLRINEDLVEALALQHDIGHPPFGHTGEEILDDCLKHHGGFNHNRHTLRVVEALEQRGLNLPGLNLSREVLEGQSYRVEKQTLRQRPLLEVQIVEAADSIAYDTHDADDALELQLLRIEDLLKITLWDRAAERVRERFTNLDALQFRRAVVHELLDWQTTDLLHNTRDRLERLEISTVEDVRQAEWIVRPDPELAEQKAELESYLFDRVYRHPIICKMREEADHLIREVFARLLQQPEPSIPAEFLRFNEGRELPNIVGDFIACQTDRSLKALYAALTG